MTAQPRTHTAARPVRRRPLLALLAAQGLSQAGNAITIIVIPLYLLQDTGSVLKTSITGVFATVLTTLGGAFGGVLVDRLGFRRSAILADVANGIPLLAVPLLAATVGLPFWALLTLVFISGLLDTPGTTAKSALLPELAEGPGVRLAPASGAQSAISRSATLLGASVAGLFACLAGVVELAAAQCGNFRHLRRLIVELHTESGSGGTGNRA